MRRWMSLKNSNGSAVVMALVVLAIIAVFAVIFVSWKGQQNNIIYGYQGDISANLARSKIYATILNDDAWASTLNCNVAAPPADCDFTGATGTISLPSNLALMNPDKTIFYDSRRPNAGFDTQGNVCYTFDATKGNDQCPFRFDVRAVFVALPGPPPTTQTTVTANFSMKFKTFKVNLNASRFEINQVRGSYTNTTENNCKKVNTGTRTGIYDQSSGECSVYLNQPAVCPPGKVVQGIKEDASGSKFADCIAPPAYIQSPCTGHNVIFAGFDVDGTYHCALLPNGL